MTIDYHTSVMSTALDMCTFGYKPWLNKSHFHYQSIWYSILYWY